MEQLIELDHRPASPRWLSFIYPNPSLTIEDMSGRCFCELRGGEHAMHERWAFYEHVIEYLPPLLFIAQVAHLTMRYPKTIAGILLVSSICANAYLMNRA